MPSPTLPRSSAILVVALAVFGWVRATEPAPPPPPTPAATEPVPIEDPEVVPAQARPSSPRATPTPESPGRPPAARLGAPPPPGIPATTAGPAGTAVSGNEARGTTASDPGSLPKKTQNLTGFTGQSRNPVVNDISGRGFRWPDLLGGGSSWVPARQDLDTVTSKLDAGVLQQLVALKGPYTATRGPGFAFVDVRLAAAPRYAGGYQTHGSTGLTYQTNGQQWFGRQTLMGGADDWGWRVDFGQRAGNDYRAGNGSLIPASYNSRYVYGTVGLDLTPDSQFEVSYLRVDQHNVELPAQAYDINALAADAFETRYVLKDQALFDRLYLETWYNRTTFDGDAQGAGKRRQNPILDIFKFTGFTDVDAVSAGYTGSLSWGRADGPRLTLGSDLRFVNQRVGEVNRLEAIGFNPTPQANSLIQRFGFIPPGLFTDAQLQAQFPLTDLTIRKEVPRSDSTNPGLFGEYTLPVGERLDVTGGGRLDYVGTRVRSSRPVQLFDLPGLFVASDFNSPGSTLLRPFIPVLPGQVVVPRDFLPARDFFLYSFFLRGDYKVGDHATVFAAGGHAQRPPSLTELYALNGPFLGILQRGSNFVFGNPALDPSRLWQIDLGLNLSFDRFRAGVGAFHGWVNDYVTLRPLIPLPIADSLGPLGAPVTGPGLPPVSVDNLPQTIQFVNTSLATLLGGEAFAEFDATDWATPFGTLSYVRGDDRRRSQSGALPPGVFYPRFPPVVPEYIPPDEEPLPGIPPLESRLGVRFHEGSEQPRWNVQVWARVVASQNRVARTLREVPTPAFTTWNLLTSWQLTRHVLFVFGVENIGNKLYREHLDLRTSAGFFQPGRNFFFTLQADY